MGGAPLHELAEEDGPRGGARERRGVEVEPAQAARRLPDPPHLSGATDGEGALGGDGRWLTGADSKDSHTEVNDFGAKRSVGRCVLSEGNAVQLQRRSSKPQAQVT